MTKQFLEVYSGLRLSGVNELLGELHRHPGRGLQFAYQLKYPGLLLSASMCQLVLTWALSGDRRVLTHWDGAEQDRATEVRRLIASDHGLLAALSADDILDKRGVVSMTNEVRVEAEARLHKMDRPRPEKAFGRGYHSLALVCDDRGGHGTPRSLYEPGDNGPTVRDEDGFVGVLEWLMRYQRGKGVRSEPAILGDERFEADVAAVVYELFRNTDDWARFDADGDNPGGVAPRPLRRARMLRAEWHEGGAATLGADIGTREPRLAQWLAALEEDAAHVLELSVLDAGPGLAARWLSARGLSLPDAPVELQRDGALWCLSKHATSAPASRRGKGLNRTLRLLTQLRGMLRVRTGSLDVYRDLVSDPYLSGHVHVRDWATGGLDPTAQPPVAGTLVSVLLPLKAPR